VFSDAAVCDVPQELAFRRRAPPRGAFAHSERILSRLALDQSRPRPTARDALDFFVNKESTRRRRFFMRIVRFRTDPVVGKGSVVASRAVLRPQPISRVLRSPTRPRRRIAMAAIDDRPRSRAPLFSEPKKRSLKK
jgi:hypothetical protein